MRTALLWFIFQQLSPTKIAWKGTLRDKNVVWRRILRDETSKFSSQLLILWEFDFMSGNFFWDYLIWSFILLSGCFKNRENRIPLLLGSKQLKQGPCLLKGYQSGLSAVKYLSPIQQLRWSHSPLYSFTATVKSRFHWVCRLVAQLHIKRHGKKIESTSKTILYWEVMWKLRQYFSIVTLLSILSADELSSGKSSLNTVSIGNVWLK